MLLGIGIILPKNLGSYTSSFKRIKKRRFRILLPPYTIYQKECYTRLGGEVWGVWGVCGGVKTRIININ
ncbi:MAG: hypothetical protein F6K22_25815 [Okeania sp. SIO2F4]|uniref:hypothetical protein n=1 Tax=Okeania sp. SIO2F4 TaxID=2607790 RepID=UPI0014294A34|nr:hypothetical protein [Okeania sp. SIO2F4]NES05922.1 hypothetical protein [Okeania sp. SIO2F4]NES05923.1 hypothetical protein [Okeania sp. SIO2F4]